MSNFSINKKGSGFIALTSVIIIGAVVVLLIIGIFGAAVSEMERGEARERGGEALSLANFCMEAALEELREDSDYTGGEQDKQIEGVDGSCNILDFEVGDTIKIKTEGDIAGYTRKIEAEVELGSDPLNVIGWREIE